MNQDCRYILSSIWPSFLHIPYKWGGNCPAEGIDCSGLIICLLKAVGVVAGNFDSTAAGLWSMMTPVAGGNISFGDLVFFGQNSASPSHVGFVLTSELMLEAGGGNQLVKTKEDAYRLNACVRVSPLKNRKDLVGFRRPAYP